MRNELHIELFKFDSKVDYLPYYKKYTVEYKSGDNILSVLDKINSIEKFSYDKKNHFNLKINNLYLNSSDFIEDVVLMTSNEFVIEPLSKFRSINDLLIDNSDYMEKLNLFKDYISDTELKLACEKYELDFYASNTYELNREYIGDSLLLLAYDIIESSPEYKEDILHIISNKENGIFYHTSLRNRILNYDINKEEKIESLFEMIMGFSSYDNRGGYCLDCPPDTITQYFNGFNIASFEGLDKESSSSMINYSKASYVDISLKNEDLAPKSSVVSSDFSLKIAGNILLQAKDENADFIIVRDNNDLEIFDGKQKRIEDIVGREINLPVVSKEQFSKLLRGEKDISKLGFENHKIKITFL